MGNFKYFVPKRYKSGGFIFISRVGKGYIEAVTPITYNTGGECLTWRAEIKGVPYSIFFGNDTEKSKYGDIKCFNDTSLVHDDYWDEVFPIDNKYEDGVTLMLKYSK